MKKKIFYIIISLTLLFLVLLIPTEDAIDPSLPDKKQFLWNRDSLWNALENQFVNAKAEGCEKLDTRIRENFTQIDKYLEEINNSEKHPADLLFHELEEKMFYTASLVGGCESYTSKFISLFSKIRSAVKKSSVRWSSNKEDSRNILYKIIYGGRAAVEELMLQQKNIRVGELIVENEEESQTPSASILGVKIHSGDILVSRGGAPTSALISRGSDYPGNFSHIALVYVDEKTKLPFIIEAHIERGATISSIYDYLNDKKLRVMVLRPRKDLLQLKSDSLLPHKAAMYAYNRVKAEHVPYDFEMNYLNDDKWFCSEVASAAYRRFGIDLWQHTSTISTKGTAIWLSGFGVKNFVTQEPSDLEYDSQLTVVAEWRNLETIYQDHVDNAVVESLLDEANAGKKLSYEWYMLPFARVFKLMSVIQNQFGAEGNIPEGMSAESGLRHKEYENIFNSIKQKVLIDADEFYKKYKYMPPYWKLVGFAKKYALNN